MATWVTHLMVADNVLKKNSFPDYMDYLPKGAIVRKVKVIGYMPQKEAGQYPYIGFSKEEYNHFVNNATQLVAEAIKQYKNKQEKR